MKKIVSAVALAAILSATASAADISFSYKGSNYFTSSAGNLNYKDRTDCMSLGISSDKAGAVVDFDTELAENGSIKIVQDEYYGWMNFALPSGNLQLKAGSWNSRYVNRLLNDKGDLDKEDFELNKPGVINGSTGKDSDNLTQGKLSVVAALTNSIDETSDLMFKFGLVKSAYNPDAKTATVSTNDKDVENGDIEIASGFVAELAYKQQDLINVNLAFKNLVKNNYSVGLWVSPLMIEDFSLTVGGTFATVKGYDKTADEWNGGTEFGADIRARYAISEEVSVTTMHNISSGYNAKTDNNTLKLWDMINFNYKMDEKVSFGCTLNAVFDNLDSDHTFTGADLITSPYIRIDATEKAAVTAALRVTAEGVNPSVAGHEEVDVTVPVLFAFNY